MSCVKAETLFALEDKFMKQPGLYLMWTVLFIANLIALVSDDTNGACRDFNIFSSILTTLYCGLASANQIYGNQKPSAMLLIAGPLHQYSTWLLLAYYRGNVYGTNPVGVYNGVYTVVVSVFTVDMVVKTWITAIYPNYYLNYVKKQNSSQNNQADEL